MRKFFGIDRKVLSICNSSVTSSPRNLYSFDAILAPKIISNGLTISDATRALPTNIFGMEADFGPNLNVSSTLSDEYLMIKSRGDVMKFPRVISHVLMFFGGL